MPYSELIAVSSTYSPEDRAALVALAERYRRRNEREILGLAAVASDIALDDLTSLGLEPDANPQLQEAFKLANRSVVPDSLVGLSENSINGYVANTKGKYFEVLVRDRLNDQRVLGELRLEPGQKAVLAESRNQPGWDLEIIDRQGETVEQIQLKATESMSYVRDALEKYPDFRVAGTGGVGQHVPRDSRYRDIRF